MQEQVRNSQEKNRRTQEATDGEERSNEHGGDGNEGVRGQF